MADSTNRGVEQLSVVRDALADVYTQSGIDLWLASPNRNLNGRVPQQPVLVQPWRTR